MYIATDLSKKKTKKRMTKMERSFVSCNVGFRTGNALRVAADSPAKRKKNKMPLNLLQLFEGLEKKNWKVERSFVSCVVSFGPWDALRVAADYRAKRPKNNCH